MCGECVNVWVCECVHVRMSVRVSDSSSGLRPSLLPRPSGCVPFSSVLDPVQPQQAAPKSSRNCSLTLQTDDP
ncbi:nescient helix loop helix 1 (predicted), isoform CRA_b [Rattus norvegicus]|uniref:Nescient helix loop helix 1 (Predicted), isoform CRA_b n=1 Tax=Rattus norvegicus TaxID=10116 RepID=A6JG18_RAT|nr:nescient helix loop helix 1 (predicted), isoform CRA_b [Rattus norvegicus]